MVELTTATGRAGFKGCFDAARSPDNIPTYAGIGFGMIAGNAVAKTMDNLYCTHIAKIPTGTSATSVENAMKFVARSAGRLVASSALCALSGSSGGKIKTAMESAALGSAGMIAVDVIKTYAPEPLGGYADLQTVPARRYMRTALQTPVVAGRPSTSESGSIIGGKPQQSFTSSRIGGK